MSIQSQGFHILDWQQLEANHWPSEMGI